MYFSCTVVRATIGLCFIVLGLAACHRNDPALTLRIDVNERGYPKVEYVSGPARSYSFSSGIDSYECRLGLAGQEPSVTLTGKLKWLDKNNSDRALVSYQLKNTERVIVELAGMHPDNSNASEKDAMIQQEFFAGDHQFKREVVIIYTYD